MSILPKVFLPENVPPDPVLRIRDFKLCQRILLDSVEDNSECSIFLNGVQGLGKRVFSIKNANYFSSNYPYSRLVPIFIDGRDFESNYLIFQALEFINSKYPSSSLLNKIPNLQVFLSNRNNSLRPIFVVNNIEKLFPKVREKFVQKFQKQRKLLICTMNCRFSHPISRLFNYPLKIRDLNYRELFNISKDVREASLFHQLTNDHLRYLCLNLCSHNLKIPGKVVDLEKELYLKIQTQTFLEDNFSQVLGEKLGLSYQVSERDLIKVYLDSSIIEKRIIEHLIAEYKNTRALCLHSADLYSLYKGICHDLDRTRSKLEFTGILTRLERNHIIISENRFLNKDCGDLSKIPYEGDHLFLLIDTFYYHNLIRRTKNERSPPNIYL